jgi:hypothetical protein
LLFRHTERYLSEIAEQRNTTFQQLARTSGAKIIWNFQNDWKQFLEINKAGINEDSVYQLL